MEAESLRNALLMFGCVLLAVSCTWYGVKFIQRHNYFWGVEWLIVGFSATNFLFYFATFYQESYDLMIYLDAFSRAFGIPHLGILGFMTITHNFRPGHFFEIGIIIATLIATWAMLNSTEFEPVLPYFYILMFAIFGGFMAYIVSLLFGAGRSRLAWLVIFGLIPSAIIAGIYDFYKIPGDETNIVFNFFFLALIAWSLLPPVTYYAYAALDREPHAATKQLA